MALTIMIAVALVFAFMFTVILMGIWGTANQTAKKKNKQVMEILDPVKIKLTFNVALLFYILAFVLAFIQYMGK